MLKSLSISNYALITSLKIDFRQGLSTITGETGAGKSILMGALSLILGARADLGSLKDKTRKCVVEGNFSVDKEQFNKLFKEHDLDLDEEVILRREILASGKSRAFINDTPVTLPVMKEVGDQLVDIHAQHQNLMLNQEHFPLMALDAYLGLGDKLEAYRVLYREYRELAQQLKAARRQYENDQQNRDFIEFQLNQLIDAKLDQDSQKDLENEREVLEHAEEIQRNVGEVVDTFDEAENSVLLQVKQALSNLRAVSAYFSKLDEPIERFESLQVELKDLVGDLSGLLNEVESDPARLEYVQERLDLFYTLQQKHQLKTQEELIMLREELDGQLLGMELSSQSIDNLESKLEVLQDKLNESAKKLSGDRAKGIGSFCSEVKKLLQEMGLEQAEFGISQKLLDNPGPDGMDELEFLFAANRNQEATAVTKVASGGEVSRLMLSIKGLISKSLNVNTLIFDEIDAGVSGEIADKMGRVIQRISTGRQVLNITHLPQVASKGDQHYLVYKYDDEVQTHTEIKLLNPEERVAQLARMLSGEKVTDEAVKNARMLLN